MLLPSDKPSLGASGISALPGLGESSAPSAMRSSESEVLHFFRERMQREEVNEFIQEL